MSLYSHTYLQVWTAELPAEQKEDGRLWPSGSLWLHALHARSSAARLLLAAEFGSASWVEVTREANSNAEGAFGYGCWFYPAVGSGIYLSTGELAPRESWIDAGPTGPYGRRTPPGHEGARSPSRPTASAAS